MRRPAAAHWVAFEACVANRARGPNYDRAPPPPLCLARLIGPTQLVFLRTLQWLATHDLTVEEYDGIKRHLHASVNMVDLERAESFLDAIGKAMHPDDAAGTADELSQIRQRGHLPVVEGGVCADVEGKS